MSQWGPRPEGAAPGAPAREPRSATIASQLDQNPRDGWIDDYDLPYDQLELLQRAREAAAAADAARQEPFEAVRVARDVPPPPVAAPAPPVDAKPVPVEAATPHIDLLA